MGLTWTVTAVFALIRYKQGALQTKVLVNSKGEQ